MSDKPNVPANYWLCAAELLFISKAEAAEGKGNAAPVMLNVVFTVAGKESNKLTSKYLNQAQQAAQQQFFSRLSEEQKADFQVVDVVFQSFSPLGYMTPAEFLEVSDEELQKGMNQGAQVAAAQAAGNDTVQ